MADEEQNYVEICDEDGCVTKCEVYDVVDEYVKSQRATDIKDKYKELGVMTINTVSDNSDDARGIPHYMVGEIDG